MDFHESQNERYGSDWTYRVGVDVGVDFGVGVEMSASALSDVRRRIENYPSSVDARVNAVHEIVEFKFLYERGICSFSFPQLM